MKKTEKTKSHNFHLVLNTKLKIKIIRLSKKMNESYSNTAVYILNQTLCILNKYHFNMSETDTDLNYQYINWDEDIHIYMDKILYRKIKHLSDTMHSFSIGIVIRKLLEIYFKFLKMSKGKTGRVERIFRRFYLIYVKEYGNKQKKWNKNIENEQLLGKFYYYLIFNEKFTLTGFDFNNSV